MKGPLARTLVALAVCAGLGYFAWKEFNQEGPDDKDKKEKVASFDKSKAASVSLEREGGESLKIVVERVLPYWQSAIVPQIKAGKKILIAAHGNSLRALLKHLEGMSDAEIEGTNIPTGVPRAYKLNDKLLSARHGYVGDPDEIAKRINTVANQTKKA